MLVFSKPRYEELCWKEALLADPESMSYNAAWGGVIPFPEEKKKLWYPKWVEPGESGRFYRYLMTEDGFAGEAAYHTDEEGRVMLDVIVRADRRRRGIGRQALRMLCGEAGKRGIRTVWDELARDNAPALELFFSEGFEEVSRTEQTVLVRKVL